MRPSLFSVILFNLPQPLLGYGRVSEDLGEQVVVRFAGQRRHREGCEGVGQLRQRPVQVAPIVSRAVGLAGAEGDYRAYYAISPRRR